MFHGHCILSENPCNIMTPRGSAYEWGIGGYVLPSQLRLTLYSDTNGTVFGTLKRKNSRMELLDRYGFPQKITSGDLERIMYLNRVVLKTQTDTIGAFQKVFWHSFERGLYLKKAEVKALGMKWNTYKDLLQKESELYLRRGNLEDLRIGVNLPRNCLNLRKSPSLTAEKITCIHGNDWAEFNITHLLILEFKENWAKIETIELGYDPTKDEGAESCAFKEVRRRTGWLKAIDDNGFPNIWFSVTAY